MHTRGLLVCAIFAMCVLGCSADGLSGEYRDPRGVTGYEFEPDGRVFITVMGTMTTGTYELEADRVLIEGPEGIVVLIRKGEDLEGPLGLRLIRVL